MDTEETREGALMEQPTRILVIGGGYAGVAAANRLTRDAALDVTLVNERPVFVERIRLHQLAAGTDDAVVEYGKVLAPSVRLLVDTVERIDVAARSALLVREGPIAYDYLIYAAGSGRAVSAVPGAVDFALPVTDLTDAERLRDALAASAQDAQVAVVGGGPAGIEVAAELAETGRRVTLFCAGQLGPSLHARARRSVAEQLAALGVAVEDRPGSRVTAVLPEGVVLADGRTVRSAVTVWATGFGVPQLARLSGLSTDDLGRLLTDETLTSVDDDRIVAAGDSASPSGVPLRMSCQAAVPLGGHAADTVLRRIRGEQPAPFVMGFVGMCISLGRGRGVFQAARRNDTAVPFHIGGRAGALVKATVCRMTVGQLGLEARHPGMTRLPAAFTDPERRRMLAVTAGPAVTGGGKRS
jgi:NADH dehydrogenase FAD-containing subunit